MTCDAARLLKAASRGDERSARELWDLLGPRLIQLAHTIVRNLHGAEDVVQQVFVESLSAPASELNRLQSVEGWFIWKTRKRAIDVLRSDRRRLQRERRSIANRSVDTSGTLAPGFRQRPAAEREMLVLRHVFEMSFEQIARSLKISTSTALQRYQRAIDNAREGEA